MPPHNIVVDGIGSTDEGTYPPGVYIYQDEETGEDIAVYRGEAIAAILRGTMKIWMQEAVGNQKPMGYMGGADPQYDSSGEGWGPSPCPYYEKGSNVEDERRFEAEVQARKELQESVGEGESEPVEAEDGYWFG